MLAIFLWRMPAFVFCLFISANVFSQPTPVTYSGEKIKRIEFGALAYLPSGDSITTLEKAQANFHSGKFIINNLPAINLGIAKDNYWVVFTVTNPSERNYNCFVLLENPRLNDVHVYLTRSGSPINTFRLGDNFSFNDRQLNYNEFAFPISFPARDSISIFLFIKHKGNTLQMPVRLMDTDSLLSKAEGDYLHTGITTGIFLIAFFFGLFFLFNTKDPLFIFYSGYMFSAGLWVWTTEGFAFQYFWPDSPDLATRLGPGISAVSACFFMGNCLQFCKPYDSKSLLRKVLLSILILLAVWSSTPFLPFIPITEKTMSVYLSVYFSSSIIIAILMSFYLLNLALKGHWVVLYFFVSVLITMSCAVVVMLKGTGIITIPFSSSTVMSSGYIAELILMTAGITKQFYIYRKEKEETLLAYLDQQKSINERILKTQEMERERIGYELHDDIGSGLTQISLMSEAARAYSLSSKNNLKEVDEIATTSRNLVQSMGEIIWALNPTNRTLGQLLIYLREHLSKLLEYSGIEYSIDFPQLSEEMAIHNVQLRNIFLITKEAVNNAVKYSHARKITVTFSVENSKALLAIKDDGIGMNTSEIKKGNGMNSMKRRVEEVKGTMQLISHPGGGTLCSFSIPL
jgi:signal transduction histidine kinase